MSEIPETFLGLGTARLYQGVNSFASCERLRVDEVGMGWKGRLEKTCSWGPADMWGRLMVVSRSDQHHLFFQVQPTIFIKFPYFVGAPVPNPLLPPNHPWRTRLLDEVFQVLCQLSLVPEQLDTEKLEQLQAQVDAAGATPGPETLGPGRIGRK